ncbi:PAS domain S-box-containing protein [Methylobacterium sp. 174MFSha1.1]|uniref:PAS domain-containing protein n=1 Tax=Methylobacterium sp. 174MFSha1.1 TaxID=1502749 RepID=UPI0008F10701|nr:PAS domain-containing protein [Methylobacterium sp. 174MFSha1.1]SFV14584.1 PAS domain S-box-containing protein [Methylobacterium sp. 174MFSha1.1]
MRGAHHTLHLDAPSIDVLAIPDAVGSWDWDIASNCIYADDVVARLFGVGLRQASTGIPIERFVAGIHPDDRQWVSAYIHRTAESSGVLVAEYRTCPQEGEVRWVLARGRFYHDVAGRPLRSHGIIVDITDRKEDSSRFVVEPLNQDDHPLERAADQCMALRDTLAEVKQPFLLKLTDMLLLELARELSKLVQGARRRRLS